MRRKSLFIIVLLFFSIFLSSCKDNINELKVDVIDVGQGDSILIVTPDRKSLLVDAGEHDFSRSVIRDIKINKIKKLDYVLGTHSDSDHIGGMDDVIEEVGAENLILSQDNNMKPELNELLNAAKSQNTNVLYAKSGDTIDIGDDTSIYILSPEKITDDPNKNSLVFLMKYKEHSLMFTGDADSEIEGQILRNYNLSHCDFLKAGHHGSKTSSSEKFIEAITPNITAISCGYQNRYGHPSKETLETLSKYNSNVYRTDLYGTLHFYFNDEGVFAGK